MLIVKISKALIVFVSPYVGSQSILLLSGSLKNETQLFKLNDNGTSSATAIDKVIMDPVYDIFKPKKRIIIMLVEKPGKNYRINVKQLGHILI